MEINTGYLIINETATTDIRDSKIISEDKNSDRLVAEGTLQDLDVINRNRRYYEQGDIVPELTTIERTKELFKTGYMRGHMGHPVSTSLQVQQTIDPMLTCVQFLDKFTIEGNLVKGRYRGTFNEYGETFNRDLMEGCLPAFSLRALGSIQNVNGVSHVKNLKFITYDHVIYPSHKKAYTEKIITPMSESAINESSILYIEENDKGLLIPITNNKIVDYVKEESKHLKSVLNTLNLIYEDVKIINGGSHVQIKQENGDIFVINLESYIKDEMINYCIK